MEGIDWKRYAQLCRKSAAPAVKRFEQSLRRASRMATYQSIPVYTGEMEGSLITVFRQMTDTLKQMAGHLPEEDRKKLSGRSLEDALRAAYFERLCGISNLLIAAEYACARLQNKPADRRALLQWVNSLLDNEEEIARIVREIMEQISAFARDDVPYLVEMEQLGIRLKRQAGGNR